MHVIERNQLEEKLSSTEPVTLIDALSEKSFREFHLPKAVNIPLEDEHFEDKVRQTVPDRESMVVVYCEDASSEKTPKAAKRIEELGYSNVHEYRAGRQDWKKAGNAVVS